MAGQEIETSLGTVRLEVDRDRPQAVTVHVNGVPSSYVDLLDPSRVGFEYLEIMAAALAALYPGRLRVTHLGGAGCTLARAIDHERPGSVQIVVELDAKLAQLARDWFDLPRAPRLRIRTADARTALAAMQPGSADVVVRDAFAGETTPAHLTTVGFYAEVGRVLRPGGCVLANIADRPPLKTIRSEAATIRAAWGDHAQVAIAAEPGMLRGRRYGNAVLVGIKPPAANDDSAAPDLTLIERPLRSLAVPVRTLLGTALDDFVAGWAAFEDSGAWPPS